MSLNFHLWVMNWVFLQEMDGKGIHLQLSSYVVWIWVPILTFICLSLTCASFTQISSSVPFFWPSSDAYDVSFWQEHFNYYGMDEQLGHVILSIKNEVISSQPHIRVIVR